MTMFEQAYEQIQQWSNGLMEEILRPTPAHFRDLDKKYETDLADEKLLTFSQPLAEGEELDILQDTTAPEAIEAVAEPEAVVEVTTHSDNMLDWFASSEGTKTTTVNGVVTYPYGVEAGKFADLIILDKNLYNITPNEISEVRVVATIIEGKTVFSIK